MYCKNCGCQLADDHNVCTQCGTPKGAGNGFCPQCGEKKNDDSVFCTGCGFQFSQTNNSNNAPKEIPLQKPTEDNSSSPVNIAKQGEVSSPQGEVKSEPIPFDEQNTTVLDPSMLGPQNGYIPQQPNVPMQNGMPQQPNMPMQKGMPQQPNMPMQNGMPQQPNMLMQNGMPQQPNMLMQNGMPQNQQYYQPAPMPKRFCRVCGKELIPNQSVCMNCNTKYGDGQGFCHHCGEPAVPGATVCNRCHQSLKPPFSAGKYFGELLNNFVSVIKTPDIIASVARHIPSLLALVLFVLMFFPLANYSVISTYSYSYNLRSLFKLGFNAFGLSVFGGLLSVLAFVAAIIMFEPFIHSFIYKNRVLKRLSVFFVSGLDVLALGCMALGFISKATASENTYIFYAKYPEMNITIMGWIFAGIVILSLISSIFAFIKESRPASVNAGLGQSNQNKNTIPQNVPQQNNVPSMNIPQNMPQQDNVPPMNIPQNMPQQGNVPPVNIPNGQNKQ